MSNTPEQTAKALTRRRGSQTNLDTFYHIENLTVEDPWAPRWLATDRSKAMVLVQFLMLFGVDVSCRILYSIVSYLYVSCIGYILLKKDLHHLIFTKFLSNVLNKYTKHIF